LHIFEAVLARCLFRGVCLNFRGNLLIRQNAVVWERRLLEFVASLFCEGNGNRLTRQKKELGWFQRFMGMGVGREGFLLWESQGCGGLEVD